MVAGGPCLSQVKENTDQLCCSKCAFYEKLDRDYLDYVKKEINQRIDAVDKDKLLPTLNDILDEELGNVQELDWEDNHTYHLSWAVFKHLPCKY